MKSHMYLILLTLIIFMLDLNTPLGIAGGVPYILIMLLAFSLDIGVVFLWGIAILCSVLVITGFFITDKFYTGPLCFNESRSRRCCNLGWGLDRPSDRKYKTSSLSKITD